ncbi:MAG: aminotransferase class V-fold PLP-dependent enzyme [Candidatus Acidiferrales bacterium]
MKDYRADFADFEGVTFLNVASQGPLPDVSAKAARAALEWKRLPYQIPDGLLFGLPDRVRALAARMIGGSPGEISITTGASGGLAAVAQGIDFQPGDEVLVARGEFPAHFSTWLPLEKSVGIQVKRVDPKERFLAAEDFLAQIGPRTRVVSTSLVRFDNAVRLDARRLADACHAVGAYLLLDASQGAGAMKIDVAELGADFLVCAGYKWLLSPYGTGFFWIRRDLIETMRPAPSNWTALEGADNFSSLVFDELKFSPGARRWDSPETASFSNLAAMEASLEYLLRVGVETVWNHNQEWIDRMIERLPRDRCVLASPEDAARRGPFICVSTRREGEAAAIHKKLAEAHVFVSLREGALRISPHLFNTERDMSRLISILSV